MKNFSSSEDALRSNGFSIISEGEISSIFGGGEDADSRDNTICRKNSNCDRNKSCKKNLKCADNANCDHNKFCRNNSNCTRKESL